MSAGHQKEEFGSLGDERTFSYILLYFDNLEITQLDQNCSLLAVLKQITICFGRVGGFSNLFDLHEKINVRTPVGLGFFEYVRGIGLGYGEF